MTLSDLSSLTFRQSRRTFNANILRLAVACSALMPAVTLAENTAAIDISPTAELALYEPADFSSGIRLKLHGIEDLRLEGHATPAGVDGVDEVKKQALAKYLADKFRTQETLLRKYIDLAWAEASKRDWLDPELLIAIIQKESSFRPKVQSRYGAQGLMQVVRRWHRDKLHPSESLFDPEVNIRVGVDVLEEYLDQANGNLDDALRKYSGNARGYANRILSEKRKLARIAEQAATQATLTAQG